MGRGGSSVWRAGARRGAALASAGVLSGSLGVGPARAATVPQLDLAAVAVAPDGLHGWAVGHSGSQIAGTVTPAMLATTDGGRGWAPQTAPSGVTSLEGVAFADSQHGWAVGAAPNGTGAVIATADGGSTWHQQVADGSGGGFTAVATVDGLHAWAGGVGYVVATVDGSTWTRHALPSGPAAGLIGPGPTLTVQALSFSDALHGWAAGNAQSGQGTAGFILATQDGGASWSQQYPDPLALSSTTTDLTGISFTDSAHGHAVGYLSTDKSFSGDQAVALETGDGGRSWVPEAIPTDLKTLTSVSFMDTSHGWAVGQRSEFQGGAILGTGDGGHTWADQEGSLPAGALEDPGSVAARSVAGIGHAWVSTSRGVIAATMDAGIDWQVQWGLPVTLSAAASTGILGGTVSDQATLANASGPTGTLTFRLFGPQDPGCTGPPVAQSVRTVSYDGTYLSDPAGVSSGGAYHWVASYSGDAVNPPVAGACGDPGQTSNVPDAIALSPRPATAVQELAVTARVTGGSTAMAGMPVVLTYARLSGDGGTTLTGVTDDSGNASFDLQFAGGPGDYTITAFADPDSDGAHQAGEPLDSFPLHVSLPPLVSGNASAVHADANLPGLGLDVSGLFPSCQAHLASGEPPGWTPSTTGFGPAGCQQLSSGASLGSASATGATEEITAWGTYATGGVTARSRLARAILLPGRPGGALLDVSSVDGMSTVSCTGGSYGIPSSGWSVGSATIAGIPVPLPAPDSAGENVTVPVGPPGSPLATVTVNHTAYDAVHNVKTAAPLLVDFPAGGPLAQTIVGQIAVAYTSSGLQGCAPPLPAATVLAPAALDLGSEMVGAPGGPRSVTLSNPSTTPMTVGRISASPADYTAASDCAGSLAPGTACTISVTFTPAAAGSRPGTLSVWDSLAGSPHSTALSGIGSPALGGDASALRLEGASLLRGTPVATRIPDGAQGLCEAGPVTTPWSSSTAGSGSGCGLGPVTVPVGTAGVTVEWGAENVTTDAARGAPPAASAHSRLGSVSLRLPDGTELLDADSLESSSSLNCRRGGAPSSSSSVARLRIAGQEVATHPVGSRIIVNPTGRNSVTVYGNPITVNPTGSRVPMATVTLNYSRYSVDPATGTRAVTSSPAVISFPPGGPLAGTIVGSVLLSYAESRVRGCG